LALNEDREVMTPEYIFPDFGKNTRQYADRSMIQAWFAGAHIDIGGSAKKDGLSLYPLQWMLLESQAKGLVLEFSQIHRDFPWAKIDNPLKIAFPGEENDEKGLGPWSCTTENGKQNACSTNLYSYPGHLLRTLKHPLPGVLGKGDRLET
jgi:hypothetical protein